MALVRAADTELASVATERLQQCSRPVIRRREGVHAQALHGEATHVRGRRNSLTGVKWNSGLGRRRAAESSANRFGPRRPAPLAPVSGSLRGPTARDPRVPRRRADGPRVKSARGAPGSGGACCPVRACSSCQRCRCLCTRTSVEHVEFLTGGHPMRVGPVFAPISLQPARRRHAPLRCPWQRPPATTTGSSSSRSDCEIRLRGTCRAHSSGLPVVWRLASTVALCPCWQLGPWGQRRCGGYCGARKSV